ncbi:MAG: efflux RND transporter periplasmic adaptor subunit [Sphingobacteriales bacterium]|nr:MAG: efflux RND transporter periplasmic adaptor subunit [Sphingobacteriales bacterium]
MTSSTNKIFIPLIFIGLLSAGTIGCKSKTTEKTQVKGGPGGRPNKLSAEAYVVVPQVFENEYVASGSLLPNEELNIQPEVSGRITNISFKEGTNVRKGQTLVQLYSADIAAQVQKLRAQRQLQVKTQQRQKQLLDIGGISRQEYETTQTQIKSIDADIAFAQAQLRATRIVAPFDGRIGVRNVSVGAIVSPTTVITSLQQVHQLKMDFTVPDQYRKYMQNGKQVYFTVTEGNDTLSGKISAVDAGADVNTRTIRVRAIVPNSNGNLTAGSFARVIIPFESDRNAILIPSQAVIPTSKDKQVVIVRGGKATMVTVTLGTRTSDKIEVTQGLQAGDTVIITGLMQVKPGMEVKVTKVSS